MWIPSFRYEESCLINWDEQTICSLRCSTMAFSKAGCREGLPPINLVVCRCFFPLTSAMSLRHVGQVRWSQQFLYNLALFPFSAVVHGDTEKCKEETHKVDERKVVCVLHYFLAIPSAFCLFIAVVKQLRGAAAHFWFPTPSSPSPNDIHSPRNSQEPIPTCSPYLSLSFQVYSSPPRGNTGQEATVNNRTMNWKLI